MFGALNQRTILIDEVREAVNEMKSGKTSGLDGFPVQCLNKGGMSVLEWLVRLYISIDTEVVPMDWRGTCIVPLFKKKGEKCECSNAGGISLLSVVVVAGQTVGCISSKMLTYDCLHTLELCTASMIATS